MKFGLREAVFALLLMGIPAGAWKFVFRPNNARNDEMLAQIEAKREKLNKLNRATATIGDLRKEITALDEAIKFLQSRLPNEKEIDKVLQEIWRLAEANRLNTKSIRTLRQKADIGFTGADAQHAEQPIAVQIEGNFLGFYTFLQSLENCPRIMRIRKMTLKKLKKAPQGHMQVDFIMSVFFERSNKEK